MATILENRANISYSYNGSQGRPGAESNTTSTVLVEPCSVTLTKSPLYASYRSGDTVSFVVRAENTGSAALEGVTFSDNLGSDAAVKPLTYVSDSLRVYVDGAPVTVTPSQSGGLSFTLASALLPGSSVIAVYSAVTDSDSASVTNTVTMTATGAAPAGCAINQTAESTVTAVSYANLSIYKSASADTVTSGEQLSYTFTIMNGGSAEATDVVLTDTLPSVFSVQTVSVTDASGTRVYGAGEYSVDAATNTITLPNTAGEPITVAAATDSGPGIATVTVTGKVM